MSVWMVERELPGISMEGLAAAQGAAIAEAGKSTAEGTPVRYLRSVFSPQDGRCCCLFEAANADDVQRVNDAAGLPYSRIVEALDLQPPT
jgi:Nickel responsive protein SCO4226-like